jgi:glycosyltransferase involved in cell wall biosynthesis
MRILLFNLATDADDPILGFTTHWVRALAERLEFIHVITMRAGRLQVPANVRVYSVGKEKGYSEPRRAVEFYRYLFRVLREDRIDACFSHMMPLFTVLAAPLLKWRHVPIVSWYAHPHLTWMLRLAHSFSTHMVTSLATAYPYKTDKLIVTGQGIDTELFTADSTSRPDEPQMILCVGRLSPVKDHPTLLKAVWLLQQRSRKRFRVVIMGAPGSMRDESYVATLQNQTRELGLEKIVQFEPAAPITSLPEWYRRCTVHVNMTPTGFGDKVALEAMACGKPSLVANEGFRETLGKLENRLLFSFGDAEHLEEKLSALLELCERDRDEIGKYLAQQITQLHGMDHLSSSLVEILEKVTRSRCVSTPVSLSSK